MGQIFVAFSEYLNFNEKMTGQKIQSQEAIKNIERDKKQYFNCSAVQSYSIIQMSHSALGKWNYMTKGFLTSLSVTHIQASKGPSIKYVSSFKEYRGQKLWKKC